jgi:hypothetical protein
MEEATEALAAEARRASIVDSWHTIHFEMNYLLDHGAFRAASLDQIRSFVARLDDFLVWIRNPQFRVDHSDRVAEVMSVDWPNLESTFNLHNFAALLLPHEAAFHRYLALYRVSVKSTPADLDNFTEFCTGLKRAVVVLSDTNQADQVYDLSGCLAFALGLAQGAIDRIGLGEPEPLAREFAELKVRVAQVTDIIQVMERFLSLRDFVRASAGDLFTVIAEQTEIAVRARDEAIKLESKIQEKLRKALPPEGSV